MINFRFHLVSLVAVFLALALGVVMGSTVIDRAIVDRLSSQIDSVKKRADAERADNRALRDQVKGLETSHDFLDAALVALVARQRSLGTARVATCGHDQSGIWLPAPAP